MINSDPSIWLSSSIDPLWSLIILETIDNPKPPSPFFFEETNGWKIFGRIDSGMPGPLSLMLILMGSLTFLSL